MSPRAPGALPTAISHLSPEGSRGDDWLGHLEGNRAGLWFVAPDRTTTAQFGGFNHVKFRRDGAFEEWYVNIERPLTRSPVAVSTIALQGATA